jgi:hypothetical protein
MTVSAWLRGAAWRHYGGLAGLRIKNGLFPSPIPKMHRPLSVLIPLSNRHASIGHYRPSAYRCARRPIDARNGLNW